MKLLEENTEKTIPDIEMSKEFLEKTSETQIDKRDVKLKSFWATVLKLVGQKVFFKRNT